MSSTSRSSKCKVRKFKHTPPPRTSSLNAPGDIQTSLLQVGMRVRKAIGLGYKTYHEQNGKIMSSKSDPTPERRPYGGSLQGTLWEPRPSKLDAASSTTHIYNDVPSSQESISTNGSAAEPVNSPSRKRGLDLEEDEEFSHSPVAEDDLMDAVSTHLRPIAQPKSRKRLSEKALTCADRVEDNGDFGEAEFLQPTSWSRSNAEGNGFW